MLLVIYLSTLGLINVFHEIFAGLFSQNFPWMSHWYLNLGKWQLPWYRAEWTHHHDSILNGSGYQMHQFHILDGDPIFVMIYFDNVLFYDVEIYYLEMKNYRNTIHFITHIFIVLSISIIILPTYIMYTVFFRFI